MFLLKLIKGFAHSNITPFWSVAWWVCETVVKDGWVRKGNVSPEGAITLTETFSLSPLAPCRPAGKYHLRQGFSGRAGPNGFLHHLSRQALSHSGKSWGDTCTSKWYHCWWVLWHYGRSPSILALWYNTQLRNEDVVGPQARIGGMSF